MLNIKENVALAPFTTFKIGGPAKYFVEVKSKSELLEALEWAKENNEKTFILSGGSNVLFCDSGFSGLIIRLKLNSISVIGNIIEAGAGASLPEVIMRVCKAGLSGMESMYGIPGTVGGAVRGNASAYGTEVKDVLKTVSAINTETKKVREFTNNECEFEYRNSFFKQNTEWVILSAKFMLEKKNAKICVKTAEETLAKRNSSQLQNILSAGSFFMNPNAPEHIQRMFTEERGQKARSGRVPAGWLIEKVGLKDARQSGARVSKQRANYIINSGNATAKDVLTLAERIKQEVKQKFGIELEEEVKIVK